MVCTLKAQPLQPPVAETLAAPLVPHPVTPAHAAAPFGAGARYRALGRRRTLPVLACLRPRLPVEGGALRAASLFLVLFQALQKLQSASCASSVGRTRAAPLLPPRASACLPHDRSLDDAHMLTLTLIPAAAPSCCHLRPPSCRHGAGPLLVTHALKLLVHVWPVTQQAFQLSARL